MFLLVPLRWESWINSLENFLQLLFKVKKTPFNDTWLMPRCRWPWVWLCSVNDTAVLDSAASMTPLCLTPQRQVHRCAWLRSVKYTAVIDSAASSTPLWLTPQRQGHRCAWLRSVKDTAVLDSAASRTPLCLTPQRQWHRCAWLCSVNDTAVLDSCVTNCMKCWGFSFTLNNCYYLSKLLLLVMNLLL